MRTPLRQFVAVAGITAAVLSIVVLGPASPASATGRTRYVAVTGSDVGNDCLVATEPCKTITRAALVAGSGDTVRVGPGTYDESVRIAEPLTVIGSGAGGPEATVVDGSCGESTTASFDVEGVGDTIPSVVLDALAISGNACSRGVQVGFGDVTVRDSAISDNHEDGAFVEGPGGSLTATGSTIDGNGGTGVSASFAPITLDHDTVNSNLGGVDVEGGGAASATVTASSFTGNRGYAVLVDGTGSVDVQRSTIAATVPVPDPEGQDVEGGVVALNGGTANVDTSTVDGNAGAGVAAAFASVTASNSTITGTVPGSRYDALPSGAAIAVDRDFDARPSAARETSSTSVALGGTIVADNRVDNCLGIITDRGYNLSDSGSCAFSTNGSLRDAAALLGPLADNGGPTLTRLPGKGSAALDRIPPGTHGCSASSTDQRGDPRLAGDRCDIGAVEHAETPIVITPATLPHGVVGHPYSVGLHASGGLGAPYTFVIESGHLPAGLSLTRNGTIRGTPTVAGTFDITVGVDDPTQKRYTLVIDAPTASPAPTPSASPTPTPTSATTASSHSAMLAATGTQVSDPAAFGALAIALGAILLVLAGISRRRADRHRQAH